MVGNWLRRRWWGQPLWSRDWYLVIWRVDTFVIARPLSSTQIAKLISTPTGHMVTALILLQNHLTLPALLKWQFPQRKNTPFSSHSLGCAGMRHFLQKMISQIGQETTSYLILMKPSHSSVGQSFSYGSLARLAKTNALQQRYCWLILRDWMCGEVTQRIEWQSSSRQRTNLKDYKQLSTCWDRHPLQNICPHGPKVCSQEGFIQTEQTGHPSISFCFFSLLAFRRYFLSFHLCASFSVTSTPLCLSSFPYYFRGGNLRLRQRTWLFVGESLSNGMAFCSAGRGLGRSKGQLDWLFSEGSIDGLQLFAKLSLRIMGMGVCI